MQQGLSGRLAQFWRRVAERESARLRDAFVQSETPAVSARAWLGQALAVVVLLAYVALTLLGVWWALLAVGVVGGANGLVRLLCVIGAVALLLFAWVARPRFGERVGVEVTSADAPELHALIGQVAEALGVPVPGHVMLVPDVNASMGPTGWRGTPTLTVGLGLWFGLRPQERVSVIAHELAHQRNGDPARGWVVVMALNVLGAAVTVLTPDWWMEAGAEGIQVFTNVLLRVVALVPTGLYMLILNLVGEQHQAAEFRADLMGARVAGSAAAVSALDRLHLGHLLDSALHKQRHMPERPHAFLELRHMWDSVTPERWARAREERALQGAQLDASHPPTADRMRVLEAWPHPGQVALTEKSSGWLDVELGPFVTVLERAAIDEYRYRTGS